MEKQVIECACKHDEHILLFSGQEDNDGYKCIFLSYHLQTGYPWYKRIGKAIKYIFGFKSIYGNFGEVVIDKTNIHQFEKIVNYINNKNNE